VEEAAPRPRVGAGGRPPAEGARRKARELVFRIVYQGDLMGEPYAVPEHAVETEPLSEDQRALVEDVLSVLQRRGGEVDEVLARAAENWEIGRLAATDR